MLQVCVGNVEEFKIIDTVGTWIRCVYTDDMVLNQILGVL